jgi:3-oxoacyl-[acyl-carrier-protein] synthase-3
MKQSAINLSSRAARRCLKQSGLKSSSLDILIHTGIYREEHIVEPAIASLIQRKIGANFSSVEVEKYNRTDSNGTFSFDLNNGGCGLISGLQLVDGFIQSGKCQYGMVVTGDVEPYRKMSISYQYLPAAAALILSPSTNGSGYLNFQTYAYPEFKNAFESYICWMNWKKNKRNVNVLKVKEHNDYLNLCVQCTLESLETYQNETQLNLSDIDLFITSQSPAGYVSKIISHFDRIADRFVNVRTRWGTYHTAGLGIAMKKAVDDGRFQKARTILFIGVGSGITTSFALYKNSEA